MPQEQSKPIQVRPSSIGHGMGIFAARDIAVGTVLLVEPAMWEVKVLEHERMMDDAVQAARAAGSTSMSATEALKAAYDRLYRESLLAELKGHAVGRSERQHETLLRGLLSLSSDVPGTQKQRAVSKDKYQRAAACFDNNSFFSHTAGSHDVHRIFETASRFQHSCAPNVEAFPMHGKFVAIATSPCATGSELFIDYCGASNLQDGSARRALLSEKRGFHCACSRCRGENPKPSPRLGVLGYVAVLFALLRVWVGLLLGRPVQGR